MKIAVVGAGFAGVALTYWLKALGADVTLFDRRGVGGGASGVAPGLLHPYVKPRLNVREMAGLAAAKELIAAAGEAVVRHHGILRIVSPDWSELVEEQEDLEWWEEGRIVLIRSGLTLDPKLYLQALGEGCVEGELEGDYDGLVWATGAESELPLERIKGQILELRIPEGVELPPHSLIGRRYLVPLGETCLVGATFEREFLDARPQPELAMQEILPDVVEMVPELEGAEVIDCRAGIRARPPFVGQLRPGVWALAGLGSKGLLYHALYARELATEIMNGPGRDTSGG